MPPVQFGFIMPTSQSGGFARSEWMPRMRQAMDLVAGHFDSAWCIDHLMPDEGMMLEGFTSLTYMAALYPQLRFGHTVICQSYRNPALLANMAATLQFLSGGRFILGIGAGWHEAEYRAYGYDFPSGGVRVAQLEEALNIIKAMWTEKEATFEGQYYRVRAARSEPRPSRLPPVMIGAFKPRMLALTAKYADWWNVSSTGIEDYRRLVASCEQACAAVGRDPSTLRRTWGGGCWCFPTQSRAEAARLQYYAAHPDAGDPSGSFDLCGAPEQIIDQLQPFIELGVDYFMVNCGGFPDLTTLELLASEVLPVINTNFSSPLHGVERGQG